MDVGVVREKEELNQLRRYRRDKGFVKWVRRTRKNGEGANRHLSYTGDSKMIIQFSTELKVFPNPSISFNIQLGDHCYYL